MGEGTRERESRIGILRWDRGFFLGLPQPVRIAMKARRDRATGVAYRLVEGLSGRGDPGTGCHRGGNSLRLYGYIARRRFWMLEPLTESRIRPSLPCGKEGRFTALRRCMYMAPTYTSGRPKGRKLGSFAGDLDETWSHLAGQ